MHVRLLCQSLEEATCIADLRKVVMGNIAHCARRLTRQKPERGICFSERKDYKDP